MVSQLCLSSSSGSVCVNRDRVNVPPCSYWNSSSNYPTWVKEQGHTKGTAEELKEPFKAVVGEQTAAGTVVSGHRHPGTDSRNNNTLKALFVGAGCLDSQNIVASSMQHVSVWTWRSSPGPPQTRLQVRQYFSGQINRAKGQQGQTLQIVFTEARQRLLFWQDFWRLVKIKWLFFLFCFLFPWFQVTHGLCWSWCVGVLVPVYMKWVFGLTVLALHSTVKTWFGDVPVSLFSLNVWLNWTNQEQFCQTESPSGEMEMKRSGC